MSKVSLALVIHSHQPVGNFDHVIEEACQKAYAPFLQVLGNHPRIRLSLHYSGILLEWLEKRHPESFEQLQQLVSRGQVELVGGGYFEPILPAIPDRDKLTQIHKLSEYLRKHFGARPQGAWVAERVWEPGLARPLAEAGVKYVVLDDTHFLAAGLEPSELHGTYITEETGSPLHLVPSLKSLRYTIPFQEPAETLRVLRAGIGQPTALFAMGDDCEKFGVWPGTFDHCYTNGWLKRFLAAVEDASDWLETTTVSEYLAAHPPLGRIYLPTASYSEMMEWALPTAASREFKAIVEESEHLYWGGRFERFLRGGQWRNFLAKYAESNQLHKFMLEISRRAEEARLKTTAGAEALRMLDEAYAHLLAAQCNDAYWHGVFGGLYAPHLRSALLRHLIQAEVNLDQREGTPRNPGVRANSKDFDADGQQEVLFQHPTFGMVVRPADGGTVSSLRFKPAATELINSLMRRPEPYHELVRQRVITHEAPREGPASIHDHVWSKEPNLAALLRYDRYPRHAFRTYVFPAVRQWQDFDYLRLDENGDLAGGAWTVLASPGRTGTLLLEREARHRANGEDLFLRAAKTIKTKVVRSVWQLECRTSLTTDRASPTPLALGIELVFNLLAPDAPDRYFLANGVRHPLEFKGEIDSPELLLVDEWQRVKIRLDGDPHPLWWIVPVETISQSETGFERVYQGSAILAVWRIDPSALDFVSILRAEIAHLNPNYTIEEEPRALAGADP
ncbi:MAG: alpha-amylase/4-alpha-glucanotransferase domain-containing protein [Terriglobia bacterium]